MANEAILGIRVQFKGIAQAMKNLKTQVGTAVKNVGEISSGQLRAARAGKIGVQTDIQRAKLREAISKADRVQVDERRKVLQLEQQITAIKLKGVQADLKKSISSVTATQDLTGIGRQAQDLKRLETGGIDTSKAMNQLEQQFARLSLSMGRTFRSSKHLNREFNKLVKTQKKFSFNFLTLLFAGMMLQRVFGGALRNIVDSYKKMIGLNSEFNRKVIKLGAGFTYLKFSIANALNNPVVISGITKLLDALEWLSDWAQDHPTLILFLLGLAGALFTIGTVSVVASGLIQFGMMFEIARGIKALQGVSAVGFLEKFNPLWLKFVAGALAAGAIAYVLKVNFDIISSASDARSRINAIFKGAIGGAIAGALIGSIFGGVGAIPGAIIGAIIGTIVTTVTSVVDFVFEDKPTMTDLKSVVTEMFKDWKTYVALAFPGTGYVVLSMVFFWKIQNHVDLKQDRLFKDQSDVIRESYNDWEKEKEKVIADYGGSITLAQKAINDKFKEFARNTDIGEGQTLGSMFGLGLYDSQKSKMEALQAFERVGTELVNAHTSARDNLVSVQDKQISNYEMEIEKIDAFNQVMAEGGKIIPEHTSVLDVEATSMENYAKQTERAAEAQLALYRSKHGSDTASLANKSGLGGFTSYVGSSARKIGSSSFSSSTRS